MRNIDAASIEMRHRSSLGPILLALGLLAGCIPNVSGRVAAEQRGNLLDPPAPRLDAASARCGEPTPPDRAIARRPYLQAVTSGGAAVVWTQTEGAARVALTSLDGQPLDTFQGVPEETSYLEGATQYVAWVDGLDAGETYCYALEDQGRVLAGPFALTSAPTDAERVEIVAFGDSGGATDDQLMLAEQLRTVPADLMLHTGDLAYPSGTVPQFQTGYFDVYADLIDEIPLFPTSGNHEYDTDGAGPFREVFVLPSERERWYSFDWGPVHVVALDNEVDGDEQAEWLRRDLAASDAPWTIVITHKGPYSSGPHGSNGAWRELYQPIVEAHGVQLVLSGHDHHYERHLPVNGVTYVVTGGGGYSTRPVGESETTAFAEDVTHLVYLSVEGDRMRLHAIDATGQEFDGVEIPRR